MTGKYSKIRVFLGVLLFILWVFTGLQTYTIGVRYIKWLPMLMFLISSILFTLNKLWSDIISFFVFVILIILSIISIYSGYNRCCDETSFLKFLTWQFSIGNYFIFDFIFLFCLTLYLSFTFYQRSKLKSYK